MHAFHLHPDLIELHLKSFNLERHAAESFEKQAICRLIMLCSIPGSVLPLLENLAAASSVHFITSPPKQQCPEHFDAIIAAPLPHLLNLASAMIDRSGPAASVGQVLLRETEIPLPKKPAGLTLGDSFLPFGEQTLIMGILNVTPDSFSDGGKFDQLDKALEQAFEMAEEGADIIDIGGESTRPGHMQISEDEELKRVMPVIKALKNEHSFKLPLSIDTYKAGVAEKTLAAGVEMLNDVWGLKADRALGQVAARYRVPVCLMHNRQNNLYHNLIPDIIGELKESIELALTAGIEEYRIIIDPGIGFGKDLQQNLDVMLHLKDFSSLGFPLLLGTSRKSMIGKTLDLPVEERLEGTAATVAYGISAGADIIRVHDVRAMKRTVLMTDAMVRR